jgi:hypothetical protein
MAIRKKKENDEQSKKPAIGAKKQFQTSLAKQREIPNTN